MNSSTEQKTNHIIYKWSLHHFPKKGYKNLQPPQQKKTLFTGDTNYGWYILNIFKVKSEMIRVKYIFK